MPKSVRGTAASTTLIAAASAINSARVAGRLLLLIGLLWLAGNIPARAADTYSADAVKAEFLYRFAGYVEWPDGSANRGAFTFGAAATDGVFNELRRLTAGRTAQDRPIEVRRVSGPADLEKVQILYLPSRVGRGARALIAAARGRPILVVTDEANGLMRGSIVNFVEVDGHIRFEISLTAAEHSKLRIDSGLLSVAEHVEGARPHANVPCWHAAVLAVAPTCLRRASAARMDDASHGPTPGLYRVSQ